MCITHLFQSDNILKNYVTPKSRKKSCSFKFVGKDDNIFTMLMVQISEHVKLLQNPLRDFHSVISQLQVKGSYLLSAVSKRTVLNSFSVLKAQSKLFHSSSYLQNNISNDFSLYIWTLTFSFNFIMPLSKLSWFKVSAISSLSFSTFCYSKKYCVILNIDWELSSFILS